MRSLHLLATADRRGGEVFGLELATALRSASHETEVIALTQGASASSLAVEVVPALRRPAALAELRRRARRADIVVGHGSWGLVGGTLASVSAHRPFVYRSIGDPAYWGSSRLRRARIGIQLRRAAGVVVLWPGAAETVRARYGLSPERLHVIPNAVTADRFRPATEADRAAARSDLGIGAGGPVVGCIGALSPEKRVDRAVEAVAALPGATLVIAGDGPERAAVAAVAARLLPGRHHLLGAVPDVTTVLAALDVLVLLSATEGQPGVVIEAGLSGLPVVATDVGGVGSVVLDQVTGRLLPADVAVVDVAEAIAATAGAADRLGAAARQRCVEQFSMAAVAATWDAVLRALC